MAKLKIINRYGITPNKILNSKKLTLKAKGLYAYIQSKPEGWDFAVSRIAYDNKDGIDSINTGLKELEEIGVLERKKFRTGRGHWDIEYILYEEITIRENPLPATIGENPRQENPSSENPETNKEINTNKEISNKDITEVIGDKLPEEHWNPLVNRIIESIEKACKEIGIIYQPAEKERQIIWNLGRTKVIKDLVEKNTKVKDVPEFFYKTIVLTKQDAFRNWKIFNSQTFKDNYAKFLNSFKGKKEADLKPKKVVTYG